MLYIAYYVFQHILLHAFSRHQYVSSCSQAHLSIAVRTSYLSTSSSKPVNWTCATAPTGPDPFVFAEPSQNTLANVNRQVESLTRGGLSSSVVSSNFSAACSNSVLGCSVNGINIIYLFR